MATLTRRPSGSRFIQFKDATGKRRTLPLGRMQAKHCEIVRTHVGKIVSASIANAPLLDETAKWIGGISEELHDAMADVGLIPQRESADKFSIKTVFDAYVRRRTDLKDGSKYNLGRVRDMLLEHFGPKTDIRKVNAAEADDFKRWLIEKKLAGPTVSGIVKKSRQFFRDAKRRNIIPESPFDTLKAGKQSNPKRMQYIEESTIDAVIEMCATKEWKLLFALARFAGIRIRSEIRKLTWDDIDWSKQRMVIHSPKTERYEGKETRVVPIFPKLLPHLRAAFEAAEPGEVYVLPKLRNENLNEPAMRIIKRAGIVQWPRMFQNLRSSCETDLVETFPIQVACAWIGNTEIVAMKHYLQVKESHFEQAVDAQRHALRTGSETTGHDRTQNDDTPGKTEGMRVFSDPKGI